MGDGHIKAALDIADNMALEKDQAGAIQRILGHFEAAYQFYKVDYKKKKFVDAGLIKSVFADIAMIFNGSDKSAKVLGEICIFIAFYHYAQGDDTKLVKEWAINRIQSNGLEPAIYISEEELIVLIGEEDAKHYYADWRKRYWKSIDRELNDGDDGNMPLGQHYGD